MTRKYKPAVLPLILIGCLLVGLISNLVSGAGLAVLVTAVLLFASSRLIGPQLNRLAAKKVIWGVGIGLVLMVIGQLVVLKSMPVTVYHDPYRLLSQADQLAAGHLTWHITYFWRYANNVPLAYLLSMWLRLNNLIGLTTNGAVHLLSLLLLDCFIVLALRTVWQLSHRNSLLLGSFAFLACTPFAYTYFLQVFYSDLPSMLLLLIIIRIFWQWPSNTPAQQVRAGIGLTVAVVLGALIKPNLIVLIPALAIIALILHHRHLLKPLKLWLPMVLVVVGFGLSVPANKGIDAVSHYTPKTEFAFPTTNWLLMGVNAKSNGMYSKHDAKVAIQLPSQAARQRHDLTSINKRVAHLGPLGLVKLWVTKLGILLNVQHIGNWYNGGFRAAPTWYQQHAQTLQVLTAVGYTAATLTLWLTLIMRLLGWQPDWQKGSEVAGMLALITALGYLAFHTLLWETEARYGQIILPLTLFVLASVPLPVKSKSAVNRPAWLPPTVLVLTLASMLGLSHLVGTIQPQTAVVAAQRSQLSEQYHAKPTQIKPGTLMTEKVTLNGPADYFSVQIHAQSMVAVTLTQLTSGKTYHLTDARSVYRLHHNLDRGRYQITVQNRSRMHQAVDVVRTYRYRLSASPLVINGTKHKTASLIYTSLLHSSRRSYHG
ncbi:glycosyltransferase family 39 protein [Lacticaseibacillus camelliae]|uniref:Uncharacterized protein n=1 Tax=Lacticaseibacillus camelliae DSM 22697 = JCM 13995 TaxID=1423730 RepID=A0A0R2F867_9LACO|nr:glycosyltransferase family 39 protein [Lacticaseibacillus camelliae]KRN21324.1 hypothetical protein FC75_GL002337 [Lacticaseibacillus camelliae DSM 22697 = JCM 13995]